MKFKRGLAVLLAILLMIPNLPAAAKEAAVPAAEEVTVNTGSYAYSVAIKPGTVGDGEEALDGEYFEEDGSYTIPIFEADPFFPYEVQFACDGVVCSEWFLTPDSEVEVGGHIFRVAPEFTGEIITQMSLNVAGQEVIVYPEAKEFTEEGLTPFSLLPLTRKNLTVDLTGFTPVEMTRVQIGSLFAGRTDVTLAERDKIMWANGSYGDDYTVSQQGDMVDLSYSMSASYSNSWQMIVGADDQLASENVRYIVSVRHTDSGSWLIPVAYTQDAVGNRMQVEVISANYTDNYSYDKGNIWRRQSFYVSPKDMNGGREAYVSLQMNPAVFADPSFDHVKVFDGTYKTEAELAGAVDITEQIYDVDMSQANSGLLLNVSNTEYLTMVSYDAAGNVTGCLPFELYMYLGSNSISYYSMYWRDESNINNYKSVAATSSSRVQDGVRIVTRTLYSEYPADGTYYQRLSYTRSGVSSSSAVSAAYVGLYSSIAEAEAAGAQDIKSMLFNTSSSSGGYGADYSQGVDFTIFVGADGTEDQEIYKYRFITVTGTTSQAADSTANSGATVTFSGLRDGDNNSLGSDKVYSVSSDEDSYGEFNFLTMFVSADVDLSNLAPIFTLSVGANLYAAGSNAPEVSGESYHDFSQGAVQYTASAENGENAKNYWLHIVKATDGAGWLYLNSMDDADSQTREENGVIYSTREVMLDGYHNNKHDILLTNMGTDAISGLEAELVSDVVEMDDYWRLNGVYDLAGFSGTYRQDYYSELGNMAKIRLKTREGVEPGTEVTGTLTIKSSAGTLMVLTLTGTTSDPSITTKEIPEAVKYVPYGTMIQNSNKYSWNTVSYRLLSGNLPNGMTVKPNGEIYGVPTESGTFEFTVRMTNSASSFTNSEKTFALVVTENTNENVEAATDEGYNLTQRVQTVGLDSDGSQTLVSQGTYAQFVDVYLDGVKLVSGQDYTSEEGSTRITIQAQTLKQSETTGTHTIGIEFRTTDTDTLKRAAQNYEVVTHVDESEDDSFNDGGSDDGSNDGGSDDGSNDGGSDDGSNDGGSDDGSNDDSSDQDDSESDDGGKNDDYNDVVDGVVGDAGSAMGTGSGTAAQYSVAKGDTLTKIARNYGVSLAQILAWNPQITNPNLIFPGQNIAIGGIAAAIAATVVTPENAVFEEVKKGDSLYAIAMRNGISLDMVKNLNPEIAKQKYIYSGQKIRVK